MTVVPATGWPAAVTVPDRVDADAGAAMASEASAPASNPLRSMAGTLTAAAEGSLYFVK